MTENPYPPLVDIDREKLYLLAEQKNRFHVVCLESRLGADLFITKVEHDLYPPRTSRNQLFELRILKWPEDFGIYWQIGSFPIEDFDKINEVAEYCGLVLEKGISPVSMSAEGNESFPLSGDNVYVAENKKDSVLYTNDSHLIHEAKSNCRLEVTQIFEKDKKKYMDELRKQGLNEEQIRKEIKMAWGETA